MHILPVVPAEKFGLIVTQRKFQPATLLIKNPNDFLSFIIKLKPEFISYIF